MATGLDSCIDMAVESASVPVGRTMPLSVLSQTPIYVRGNGSQSLTTIVKGRHYKRSSVDQLPLSRKKKIVVWWKRPLLTPSKISSHLSFPEKIYNSDRYFLAVDNLHLPRFLPHSSRLEEANNDRPGEERERNRHHRCAREERVT